jgi:CubicO group peptidase (beta-lactamase class C family)
MLFEEGRLRLTDPISRFIPAFDRKMQVAVNPDVGPDCIEANRPITIRDLLTHTAGLSYGFDEESYLDKLYREQVWERLGEQSGNASNSIDRSDCQPAPGTPTGQRLSLQHGDRCVGAYGDAHRRHAVWRFPANPYL